MSVASTSEPYGPRRPQALAHGARRAPAAARPLHHGPAAPALLVDLSLFTVIDDLHASPAAGRPARHPHGRNPRYAAAQPRRCVRAHQPAAARRGDALRGRLANGRRKARPPRCSAALVLTVFAWLPQAALDVRRPRSARPMLLQRPSPVRIRAATGHSRPRLRAVRRRTAHGRDLSTSLSSSVRRTCRAHGRVLPDKGDAVGHDDREGPDLRLGGISRTVRYKDFLSPTSAATASSPNRRKWSTRGLRSCPTISCARPRLSRIYYGGKYYSYPLSAFEALRNLGLLTSAACMLSYAYAKTKPIAAPKSFHDWVRNQFGERLFQIFFQDLHRESVGHAMRRDLRRLGGAADQGARPAGRGRRTRSSASLGLAGKLAAQRRQAGPESGKPTWSRR